MRSSKFWPLAAALPVLLALPALAHEPGTWVLRAGVGQVQPQSDNLTFSDGVDTITIDVDESTSLTLSGTYMFSPNWALDILAAYPFSHDINATVAGIPGSAKIGEVSQLPPTVSIQYHFLPDATFEPYVGLGLNWTTFFDEKLVPELVDQGIEDLRIDDSFGLAAQVGADWALGDHWLLNFDLRWINIEADGELSGSVPGEMAEIGTVKIDPWVYSLNLGYRF